MRLLCSVNLRAAGMHVLEAPDGADALDVARAERPDLVILDVMMPGLDGLQVAERLGSDEQTREIPIVFLTARAERDDRRRGLELGAVDYITKPFDPVGLAPRVEGVVERVARGEREELRRERLAELGLASPTG